MSLSSATIRQYQIINAKKNIDNNVCAFCSLCKYGKSIDIEEKEEKFIVCKFTINRDLQIAFDSRSGLKCARFVINPFIKGFLQQANLIKKIESGKIKIDEYNEALLIYPLPQTSQDRVHADYKRKLTYKVTRRNSSCKWQIDEEKLENMTQIDFRSWIQI